MAINEQIVTGYKFRKLVDESAKLWQRISFWTKAVDIEFNDGKTGETKLGAIDGITDSLASTSSRIAASAKAVNALNNNLTWKLLGSANGTSSIALPEQYSEICAVTDRFVFNLPRMALSAGEKAFEAGSTHFAGNYYVSECHRAVIYASLTSVRMSSYWEDTNKQIGDKIGTPIVTQSKNLTVYYR